MNGAAGAAHARNDEAGRPPRVAAAGPPRYGQDADQCSGETPLRDALLHEQQSFWSLLRSPDAQRWRRAVRAKPTCRNVHGGVERLGEFGLGIQSLHPD